MTAHAITGRIILLLLIGAAVPAQAQQEKPERAGKPAKQQPTTKPNRPDQRARGEHQAPPQPQARPAERPRARHEPERPADRPARPAQRQPRTDRGEHRGVWQRYRAHAWESEHRSWQQRGGYHGYRIPDARFRGYFGREHGFRVSSLPVLVVGGYPRFRYGGAWFSLVDPWPEYWSDRWYETDDVYIDYNEGGYYLVNRRRPGDRIAVNVFVN